MKIRHRKVYGITPRIFVILRGGLGNQLHQIGAAVKLAEHSKAKIRIFSHIVDTAITPNRDGQYRNIDIVSLFGYKNICDVNLLEKVLIRILIRLSLLKQLFHVQNDETYNTEANYQFLFLQGWFQTYEFLPSTVNFMSLVQNSDSYASSKSAHIRLGDFLDLDIEHVTSQYYYQAFQELFSKTDEVPIFCYSDDIQKAKEMLPEGYHLIFPEVDQILSPVQLLHRLAQSQIFVSSKSSLSWWAANAVSENGGIVVSPWIHEMKNAKWISLSN